MQQASKSDRWELVMLMLRCASLPGEFRHLQGVWVGPTSCQKLPPAVRLWAWPNWRLETPLSSGDWGLSHSEG